MDLTKPQKGEKVHEPRPAAGHEPDWLKKFYKAAPASDEADTIFQSDDEEDEDHNHQIQKSTMQPWTLPFKETRIKELYDARPKKKPRM